uniref:Cytochrome P450 n=1 Tax=Heterorhabditis bacteriophora TaxID=37862 RepID=A0A1I7X0E6_HETBA
MTGCVLVWCSGFPLPFLGPPFTPLEDYIRQEGQRLRTPATAPITPPRAFYRPTGIRDTEEMRRIVTSHPLIVPKLLRGEVNRDYI